MVRGVGRGRLIEGGDYLKYFHQSGVGSDYSKDGHYSRKYGKWANLWHPSQVNTSHWTERCLSWRELKITFAPHLFMSTSNMQSCISDKVLFIDLQRHEDYEPFVQIALAFCKLNEKYSKRTQWISNDDNQLALYQSCKCLSFLKRHMSGLVLNLVSQNKNGVEHNKLMHCTYLIKTVHIWQDWDWGTLQTDYFHNAINFVGTTIYYFHIPYHTPPLPIHPRKSRTIDLIYDTCVMENVKVANFLCTS